MQVGVTWAASLRCPCSRVFGVFFCFFGTRLIHITAQKDNVALFCAKKRSSLNGKVKYLKSLNLGLDPFDLLRKDRNM